MSLGKVYTLAEVAEHLRMTNCGVAKIARKHGLCMIVGGRDLIFTENDVEGIKETLRVAPTEAHRPTVTPAMSDYQIHKRLVELTSKKNASASRKLRKLALQRSKRPSAKQQLIPTALFCDSRGIPVLLVS